MSKPDRYDIIGDIHGHADALTELLAHLDYSHDGVCYRHPSRQAIFLGDFIDRGPQQRETLNIVMAMVNNGAAQSVLANHEFNALAFHTQNPEKPGTWLRPRNNKNIQQHLAFLNEYLDHDLTDELDNVLDWFMTLPLWLDLNGIRVVHACWHKESANTLQPMLGENNTLTKALLIKASTQDTPEFIALETLLKGWETKLPNGLSFSDKDGNQRTAVRSKWWLQTPATLKEIVMDNRHTKAQIPDELQFSGSLPGYAPTEKPLFLGHYWLNGAPHPLTPNIACLDYSVAKNGKLVAYRWDGETKLQQEKFIWCRN